ncbi:histidinol-phosphatase [Pararhodobacter sp. SW119]|uniref:histidinol-phosphatase n=1 Tax=Pararhodobacter sp. SW119 TaxID=2780075 RepID=UPI001AE047B8|nr:histidinol-phosphatase [Pararhodobacter sp. SW119]
MNGRSYSGALTADLWRTAHALADIARPVTLQFFRSTDLDVSSKNALHFDPVTAADRAAEAAIRSALAERRPQDAVLGEEQGLTPGTSGLTWIIDPIDGTRGYLSGTPTWGVLIALADTEGPMLGLIDQPYIGERFWGGLGEAACEGPHGRSRLVTRRPRPLEQAVLYTTFPEIGTDAERAAFERVRDRVRLVRYGMDCYAYALLAAGQIDLVIEAGLHVYDIAAPLAVIEAAGGIVTDWHGGPAHAGGQVLAAANREIHAEALALLQG